MIRMQKGHRETIRVLIVGISQIVRAGVRTSLQGHRDFSVVGEVSSVSQALEIADCELPDVILIDIDILGAEIDTLVGNMQRAAKNCLVLVLSDLEDEELTRKALCSGAAGVVLKIQPPGVLIALIESLMFNQSHVSAERTRPVPMATAAEYPASEDKHDWGRFNILTTREREITHLIGKGLRNREIAERLGISVTTVRHHLTSILSKLEVRDRQQLLIWAHRRKLIDLSVATGLSRREN
jgi:DNA-binding NarL/FixJ family response regulator